MRIHTIIDRMRGLRSCTSVDYEDGVADPKVVKILTSQRHDATMSVQQHWHNDVVPHVQYLIVLAHIGRTMTPSRSGSIQDCGSRSVWIQSRIPAALRHASVESPSLWHSPSRSNTREREREENGGAWGERRALPRSSLNPRVSNSPPWEGVYIVGWGAGLPLLQG
jgi:hypothetical protein